MFQLERIENSCRLVLFYGIGVSPNEYQMEAIKKVRYSILF